MKINNNKTSKQSANTVGVTRLVTEGVTRLVTEGVTRLVTEGVTRLVTEGVTRLVTEDVTLSSSEKEGQTHCISRGCKLCFWQGVTLPVTLHVTLHVTEKKKKNKKEENPPAPPKEEKNKKIKKTPTQTCMHARENQNLLLNLQKIEKKHLFGVMILHACLYKEQKTVEKMQDKEQQFERLFHTEYGRMYRAAHILLGDADEAKDAVQDVFARLWDGSVVLREESQRTYLLTCVRNHCLNIIAQRQRHREAEKQLSLSDTSMDADPWQGKSDDELTTMVRQYIDERLTPQTARIIRMRYDDEQSYKDISGQLGISLSAVNKHIVQGLRKIRHHLQNRKA